MAGSAMQPLDISPTEALAIVHVSAHAPSQRRTVEPTVEPRVEPLGSEPLCIAMRTMADAPATARTR